MASDAPFLSILTRTYRRPQMLAQCVASVEAQAPFDHGEQRAPEIEHLVLRDDAGVGVAGSHRLLAEANPHGCYVLHLDDDNMLTYPWFASDLRAVANAYRPDVIVFRLNNCEFGILPDRFCWQQKPSQGHIDGGCVAVKQDVWRACISAIVTGGVDGGPCYEGDYHYLLALWAHTGRIHWMDRIGVLTMRVSRGQAEEEP